MYTRTERIFINLNNGISYDLYHSSTTGQNLLISIDDKHSWEDFIINQSPFPIEFRNKAKNEFTLPSGYFIPCYGLQTPTHKRYLGQKRFTKI